VAGLCPAFCAAFVASGMSSGRNTASICFRILLSLLTGWILLACVIPYRRAGSDFCRGGRYTTNSRRNQSGAVTIRSLRVLCGCSQRSRRFKVLTRLRRTQSLETRRSRRTTAECAEKPGGEQPEPQPLLPSGHGMRFAIAFALSPILSKFNLRDRLMRSLWRRV